MNFYRLRIINTLLFIIIGVLLGIYLSKKIPKFKFIFDSHSDYKPVYYGKVQSSISENYNSVYLNNKNINNRSDYNHEKEKVFINADAKDIEFIEKVKNSQPMDEEYDFVIDSYQTQNMSNNYIDISDFVKDSYKYKNKYISGKAVLLKGERSDLAKFYFLYSIDKTAYYLTIYDEDHIIKDYTPYKIGYYYDIVFYSKTGEVDLNNKLIAINPLEQKVEWASGLNAF